MGGGVSGCVRCHGEEDWHLLSGSSAGAASAPLKCFKRGGGGVGRECDIARRRLAVVWHIRLYQHQSVCCSMLQCVAVCHSGISGCISISALHIRLCSISAGCKKTEGGRVWDVAVCCSVLQCVTVCCIVMQCVAV